MTIINLIVRNLQMYYIILDLQARQIVRTNSGKTRKEKTFKANASKALEDWAAGTTVQGKLMKKV